MFLEVIAKDIKDVEIISKSCADRIELCSAMDEDGLTPDIDLIKAAAAVTTKPIRVMIRNHNNGFHYTKTEVEVMIDQIKQINLIPNIDGYVIGALTEEQELDIPVMKRLIEAANGRNITCHKACESIIGEQTLRTLELLGVNTVLTQGGLKPIEENLDVLRNLAEIKNKENFKIEILLGGGVNLGNIKSLNQISSSIHVGKLVRINQNYGKLISDEQITQIKE